MKQFRPENRLFCFTLKLQNSRFSGILVCAPFMSHMVVVWRLLSQPRAFFIWYCASTRYSFFTPRSYDGRLSVKYRYAKDSEFLWQPSEFILPTDTSLNLVFHKNSDSFPCSFALLPSFCCGVKSELRPDVNVFLKKNSRQRFRRVVKSSFLASENIYLRRTKNENSQLLQLFATTLCNWWRAS